MAKTPRLLHLRAEHRSQRSGARQGREAQRFARRSGYFIPRGRRLQGSSGRLAEWSVDGGVVWVYDQAAFAALQAAYLAGTVLAVTFLDNHGDGYSAAPG